MTTEGSTPRAFTRRVTIKPGEEETLFVRGLKFKFYYDAKGRLTYRIVGGKVKLQKGGE